jgi:prepilin-type N-terminal cleavage/methylation domain-containing protein
MLKPDQRACLYGFTLAEVLIVMMVFAIMAATVLPQFTQENKQAQETALRQDLKLLRSQIELYRFQHNGSYPGKGSIHPDGFLNAMLLSSDADGTTGPINSKPFGPYFLGQLPPNPYTGGTRVRIVDDVGAAVCDDDPVEGWIYNPMTGRLKANCTGTAMDGTPLDRF